MNSRGERRLAVRQGDRIDQLVVSPISLATAIEVDELPPSDGRGEGGFGSTD